MSIASVTRKYASFLDAGLPATVGRAQLEDELRAIDPAARARFERRVAYASDLGVPLGAYLRQMAEQDESLRQNEQQLESAFAAPRATAKVVAGLPFASLLVAQLAGLQPFSALVDKPLAQISAGLGAMLLCGGWLIMRRLIARAEPAREDPAELLTLVAVTLQSGLSTRECLARAELEFADERQVSQVGVTEGPSSKQSPNIRWQREQIESLVTLSFSSGVALSGLLTSAAEARRAEVWSQQRQAIERVGVRLMLPLGLVVLPAFVAIGIVPVVVGMLAGG